MSHRIPDAVRLPELTLRGVLLGAAITLLFTASNVYLGLKVGLTFASAIPAAVISMAVLCRLPGANKLENNMVQTQASAAGTLSAIIFVLPGLLMIGYWQGFPFWQTSAICAIGGILGVLYTIPLRRVMVVQSDLPYPEGIAAAEILEVGSQATQRAESTPESARREQTGAGEIALGAGVAAASLSVEVLFDRAAYTPPSSNADDGVFQGSLTIHSNDADTPTTQIQLAGFWQARDEGGWEPNLNEIWRVFGFGNHIDGLSTLDGGGESVLQDFDLYRAVNDEEVLSRYWQLADGVQSAKVTQLAALHGYSGALLALHAPGDKGERTSLMNHDSLYSQSFLPHVANGNYATATFDRGRIPDSWAGDDVFGISVANLSTDPSLNPHGGGTPPAEDASIERGYTVRVFQAYDSEHNAIPDTYFVVMDYTGINYDYNDNVYLIQGIQPALRSPFNDTQTPWAVDADGLTLDAALFDEGPAHLTYKDSSETQLGNPGFRDTGVDIQGNGDAIGWIEEGEWVEYTLEVDTAGVYDLSFLSAMGAQSGTARSISATFDQGSGVYAVADVGVGYSGGWNTFLPTQGHQVMLEAGEQTLRLTFHGGAMNLASFTLTPASQSAFNADGTPWTVDSEFTLQAALYDQGGEGVAYHDSSETQLGTNFRDEGVDIRGNGEAIGWIDNGEWVEYTLDVAEAGSYQLSFAAATTAGGRSVTASVAQAGQVYDSATSASVINTGGWNNYQSNEGVTLDLTAGEQVLRLTFNGGAMNLANFTLTATAGSSESGSSAPSASDATLATSDSFDSEPAMSDDVAISGVDTPQHVEIA